MEKACSAVSPMIYFEISHTMPFARENEGHVQIVQQGKEFQIKTDEAVDFEQSVFLVDGQKISRKSFGLEQGRHSFCFELKDNQGRILESAEQSLDVDLLPPQIEAGPDFIYVYAARPYTYSVKEDALKLEELKIDGQLSNGRQVLIERGNRSIAIRAEDDSGNQSEAHVQIADVQLPQAPFDRLGSVELTSRRIEMHLDQWEGFNLRVVSGRQEHIFTFTGPVMELVLDDDQAQIYLEHPALAETLAWQVTCLQEDPFAGEEKSEDELVHESENPISPDLPFEQVGNSHPVLVPEVSEEKTDHPKLDPYPEAAPPAPSISQALPPLQIFDVFPESVPKEDKRDVLPVAPVQKPADEVPSVSDIRPYGGGQTEPLVMAFPSSTEESFPVGLAGQKLIEGPGTSDLTIAETSFREPAAKKEILLTDGQQGFKSGQTVFRRDIGKLRVADENPDSILQVKSLDTQREYSSIEQALQAEKQPRLEVSVHSESSGQSASWQVFDIGTLAAQSLNLSYGKGSQWFARDESGQLQRYTQVEAQKPLLCRGFEQVKEEFLKRPEKLRLYVPDKTGNYMLSINGQQQESCLEEDELGQPYLPLSVTPTTKRIALKHNGRTVFTKDVKRNRQPAWWAFGIPGLGAASGMVLDVRRRKARSTRSL